MVHSPSRHALLQDTCHCSPHLILLQRTITVSAAHLQVPSTSGQDGDATQTDPDGNTEMEVSFSEAAERLRLKLQEDQMPIEDRINL